MKTVFMRLKHLKNVTLLVMVVVLLFACKNNKKEIEKPTALEERPNIVFIMSDDHAFQAVSAYGHGLNSTPNIDRLASEGAIFNKGFVTNSICAPSRAVMIFCHITGVRKISPKHFKK
jgi:hypothetical protein